MAGRVVPIGQIGGPGGEAWDDGNTFTGIKQIIIGHGDAINSIQVEYEFNGNSILSDQHGGDGGHKSKITLHYPEEVIHAITSYSNANDGGPHVVRSLEFETNRRKLGPFGVESGLRFSISLQGGKIVGFFGHSGELLDSIGIHYSLPT